METLSYSEKIYHMLFLKIQIVNILERPKAGTARPNSRGQHERHGARTHLKRIHPDPSLYDMQTCDLHF